MERIRSVAYKAAETAFTGPKILQQTFSPRRNFSLGETTHHKIFGKDPKGGASGEQTSDNNQTDRDAYMDRLKDSVAGNTERAADLKTVEGIIYKHFGGSRFSRGSIMHDGD